MCYYKPLLPFFLSLLDSKVFLPPFPIATSLKKNRGPADASERIIAVYMHPQTYGTATAMAPPRIPASYSRNSQVMPRASYYFRRRVPPSRKVRGQVGSSPLPPFPPNLYWWGPARLQQPLPSVFIVGLAFNEQAEWQIKAAIIRWNLLDWQDIPVVVIRRNICYVYI